MSFIQLYDKARSLGKFDLPSEITGEGKGVFRLQKSVKGGGNGIVFEAKPLRGVKNVEGRCAIKLLKQQDDARIDRFRNEVRIIRMLDHPRISKCYDAGQIDLGSGYIVPWIAMQLGDENLREDVQARGPLNAQALLKAAMQICDALEHLHSKGIVHRDIKPDNFVWFGDDILMIDFGIAKLSGEDVSARPMDQFTQQMEFVGPVFFSSPELIAYAGNKEQVVDHRSDLFQFGKVLWFLATGKISAGVPSRSGCPLGGALHEKILKLLADDPADRFSSTGEVKKVLSPLAVTLEK